MYKFRPQGVVSFEVIELLLIVVKVHSRLKLYFQYTSIIFHFCCGIGKMGILTGVHQLDAINRVLVNIQQII